MISVKIIIITISWSPNSTYLHLDFYLYMSTYKEKRHSRVICYITILFTDGYFEVYSWPLPENLSIVTIFNIKISVGKKSHWIFFKSLLPGQGQVEFSQGCNPHQYQVDTRRENYEISAELGLSVNGGEDGDVVHATSSVAVVHVEVGELRVRKIQWEEDKMRSNRIKVHLVLIFGNFHNWFYK